MSNDNTNWQGPALENVLTEYLKEQRRRRRWGIFFKLVLVVVIIGIFMMLSQTGPVATPRHSHIALIKLEGEIMPGGMVNGELISDALDKAFESKGAQGVILQVNSPGGAPVQSSLIYDKILKLKKAHPKKKVYAVCLDVCASGAYYAVASADKIYADKASMVGSIGVVMRGFGFVEAMKKLGVERRVYTAGEHKNMLDPFMPEQPSDVAAAEEMAQIVHQQFVGAVKQARSKRLKVKTPDLFSGRIWTGEQAKKIGLIDGYASVEWVAEELFKNAEIVDYTPRQFGLPGFIGVRNETLAGLLTQLAAPTLR